MTEPAKNPELTKAIVRGAIVEVVLLAVGVTLFFATGEIYWIIGATALGSAVMVYFMAQAGAFKQP